MKVTVKIAKEDIARKSARNPGHIHLAGAFKRARIFLAVFAIGLLAPAPVIMAQDKPTTSRDKPIAVVSAQDNPFTTVQKRFYEGVKDWLVRSAVKMPEENYNFKPTNAGSSFGQIIGRVADEQYRFCARIGGGKSPALDIEHTKASKTDLVAALRDAFAYCDKAYGSATDASVAQKVKFLGMDMPILNVMTAHIARMQLDYGHLATYLELKNIVPPSTEDMPARPPQKP